jgi:PAS domain S-box-containing protein
MTTEQRGRGRHTGDVVHDDADRIRRGQITALIDHSDDAIVACAVDGTVVSWNAGAERLLGYTAAEMIGTSITIVIPPDHAHDPEVLIDRVGREGSVHGYQTVRVRKDGSRVDVSIDAAPIRGDRTEVIGVSVVARDISDRVHAERAVQEANDALRRADELKNTFLRTVSHDVRSPLTAVLSAAKLLEDGGIPDDQRGQFTRMIVRNAHRIRRLLDDVLDIERLTRGDGLEPMREEVDVPAMVGSVLEELNGSGRAIDVRCDVEQIFGDRMQLERTVYNLVGNAIKHTDSDITIRTWAEDGGTILAVEDAGPGVPDDMKTTIFEPFKRATDPHTPGTGVGLSLVAEFARAHGGRAWVEDRPGGGSSFRVFFPAVSATEAA